jgi:predicted MFS family arabinose efflux permease
VNEDAEQIRPTPLHRNRNFVLLWTGQAISTIGTRVTALAFPLLVLAETGSPAQAGVVGFAQTIPFLLLYLPAGAYIDRLDRKRVMIVADSIRALAFGTLVVALALDKFSLALVIAVSLVEGSLFVFFQLAEGAALPQVVPREQLPAAMAQNQARIQGADLVGTPLGGFLFGLGRAVPFLFDAVSYLLSALSLLFIRVPFQETRERAQTRLRQEIAEGVRWLWAERFLRTVVLLAAGSNFAFNALTLVLIVRAKELGASPALVGAMFVFVGIAAIAGALAAPSMQRRVAPSVVVIGSLWVWALLSCALVFPTKPLVLGAVLGVTAFFGPVFNVVVGSYAYALTPDRLLGRVQSAARAVAYGAIPLGALCGGLFVDWFGGRGALLALGSVMIAVAVAATWSRDIRHAPRLETLLRSTPAASPAGSG